MNLTNGYHGRSWSYRDPFFWRFWSRSQSLATSTTFPSWQAIVDDSNQAQTIPLSTEYLLLGVLQPDVRRNLEVV